MRLSNRLFIGILSLFVLLIVFATTVDIEMAHPDIDAGSANATLATAAAPH